MKIPIRTLIVSITTMLLAIGVWGCHHRPGHEAARIGDEIVVCGRYFHTGGAPVVLWTDPGGYDAYRMEKRFVPWERAAWTPPVATPGANSGSGDAPGPSTPTRYNIRFAGSLGRPECPISADEFERIRGGGWDLSTLQRIVDQFVMHYDVCGTSRQCFRVLHDMRGLSVHFMLDIDGTIYQTLDLKERAWHATTSNDRSIGIEIANIGAYSDREVGPLKNWYAKDANGKTIITIPQVMGNGGVRTPNFIGRPFADEPVEAEIQGQKQVMYDLTPEQYESLSKLTETLCRIFPNMPRDYPRDATGDLITGKLSDEQLAGYRGLLGHYHIQSNKIDPGPAFQWQRVVGERGKGRRE